MLGILLEGNWEIQFYIPNADNYINMPELLGENTSIKKVIFLRFFFYHFSTFDSSVY